MMVLVIFLLILRLIGPIYCSKKAESLNRKPGIWAIAGFLFPLISMICISLLKPITLWNEEN
jgi:hypothetical protein